MSAPWRVVRGLGLAAAAAALVAVADATMVEPYRLTTTLVPIPAGKLSSALAGGRVVHLSDLHLKGMGLRETNLLEKLLAIDPAMILMTGDYADTPDGIEALREFFGRLHPPLGIFAVPGNNDYYRGRQMEIFAALREGGVHLLVNEVVTVEAPGGPLAVAGVDDPFFGRDDLGSVLNEVPRGIPAILLAHSPSILMDRSEGILFNAGDADGPWGEGRFWTDGSHFRLPVDSIRFQGDAIRRLRIQVREDGVGLEAVRLVPVPAGSGEAMPVPRGLQGAGRRPPAAGPEVVDIDLCRAEISNNGTGWEIRRDDEGGCRLEYPEDRGRLESLALPEPPDQVEITFEAPGERAYRVWALLASPDSSGLSDSLYIQFETAVDVSGAPAYRSGHARPGAGGPPLALILAGHTHGGQVRIPWLGPVVWGLIPGGYIAGSYEAGGSQVYVSRGIGTSILPIRFACAPEVVVLGHLDGDDES